MKIPTGALLFTLRSFVEGQSYRLSPGGASGMAKEVLSSAVLLFWVATPPEAQPAAIAVESGKTARVGVYGTINKDCTAGPSPVVRVTQPFQNGRLVVGKGKVRISGGGGCPVTEVPGWIVRYQSHPNFSGADKATLEIKRPDVEATSTQTLNFNVKAASRPTNLIPLPASQLPTPEVPNTSDVNPVPAPNIPNDHTAEAPESPTRPTDVDALEEIPH